MHLVYKKCTLEDLDVLINISRSTFIDAFEAHNDPNDFERYINSAFSKEKLKEELTNPNAAFYFAYCNESQAGYFKVNQGKAQTDLKKENSLELERIYVQHRFQGKGIGKMILQEVIKLAVSKQKDFLWLGVWEHNTDAIKFYEKNGFTKFGMHPYYIGKDKQMDWLMRFDLITLNED